MQSFDILRLRTEIYHKFKPEESDMQGHIFGRKLCQIEQNIFVKLYNISLHHTMQLHSVATGKI